jgi:DNA-binding CsgD family transcriptional regulator
MDGQNLPLLASVIGAIGHTHFAETASHALCRMADFQLSSVVVHHPLSRPVLLFDDLSPVGYESGVENYLHFTHRTNPMLADKRGEGAFRASDFRTNGAGLQRDLAKYLIPAPDEELGFRTVGWPARLEEVGLYFRACGGIVELSLYRERGRAAAPSRTLHLLDGMRVVLAAAFERDGSISRPTSAAFPSSLTNREREIAGLLLTGCSSEAIALRLGISRYTVKDHRKQVYRKLCIGSLAELFALANTNHLT